MSVRRRFLAIALPLAALVAPASTSAQGRALFNWSGRVDREVQISMRGREMWTNSGSASDRGRNRFDVDSPLPRQEGQVRVRVEDGRGDVDVVQQPSARNDYTMIVRVRDRSGGADRYRISAYWMTGRGSDGGYGSGGNGGWDRGRDDRDDRGAYGRGRADDRGRNGDDDRGNGSYGRGGSGNVSLVHWSGSVDGELEIRLRGQQVTYNTVNGGAPRDVRLDGGRSMPQRQATVHVANAQGRGTIAVVQQPSAYNGYTTIVRVRDTQGGYGFYDFDLTWR